MMQMTFEPQMIPLHVDEYGTIRVSGTRVRLDTVVYTFNQGHTAEEIASYFPALSLVDVYTVIAYYLANKPAIDVYIQKGEADADQLQYEFESRPGHQLLRERLQARKRAGSS